MKGIAEVKQSELIVYGKEATKILEESRIPRSQKSIENARKMREFYSRFINR